MRFLADEDFDNDIVRGILRRNATMDIVTVQKAWMFSLGSLFAPALMDAGKARTVHLFLCSISTAHSAVRTRKERNPCFVHAQRLLSCLCC